MAEANKLKPIWIQGNYVLCGNPVPKSYSKPFVNVGQIYLLNNIINDIGSALSEAGIYVEGTKYSL